MELVAWGRSRVALEIDKKASANPTKAFFVRMITRDISLEDCILDLIDNSVDGAWHSEGSRSIGLADGTNLSAYHIRISVSPDKFSIEDNCGGMTLSNAIDHAFSFGRSALDEHADYSIGVYGIGMKRAVFKLGTDIRIRSTYLDAGQNRQSFAVPIQVNDWLSNDQPPWDFDIVEAQPLPENGVEITVESLTTTASSSFGNPAFIQNLKRTIARDYSLHLERGLSISVNDAPITGWKIELRRGDEFIPMRFSYQDDIESGVTIEIIGGMAAPPPENVEPDESDEGDKRYGWYVVCNGRIVLAADKSSISGWGTDDWPRWHYQYSGFIGIILFTAANAALLPMTTTKRSVDLSSEVFRRARPKMREVSKAWISYTNVRKQALEEARNKESAASAVPLFKLSIQPNVTLPKLVQQPTERPANISYSVPVARLRKLAQEFGNVNMPYREVGTRSFDYSYEDLVGDK